MKSPMNSGMRRASWLKWTLPRQLPAVCWLLLFPCVVLSLTGCVTRAKARQQAQVAYDAGRRDALAQLSRDALPIVKMVGPFKHSTVPWTPDLTLARAIAMAGYDSQQEPICIILVRNGTGTRIETAHLLAGNDSPLHAGDVVHLQMPGESP